MARPRKRGGNYSNQPQQSDKKELSKNEPGFEVGLSKYFANLNRITIRDLNNTLASQTPKFNKYTRDKVIEYLSDPYQNQKNLQEAVKRIYSSSTHFRRIIQYFVGLSDLSYIITPYKIDPRKANKKITNNNYRKTLNMLSSMNIKSQFPKILTVCLREDTFYGTFWITDESITVQQLPSDCCRITSIEGNVPNISFDFSYFDSRKYLLNFYPEEFKTKYELYKDPEHKEVKKWIELDAPNSFAVKCNSDILEYSVPPFAGILRELYDLEDYRDLKLAKTSLENYAMLAMKIPMSSDGEWLLDFDKAKEFWSNMDSVLPQEVGSVLTPMNIEKISFERSGANDIDTVAEAEKSLFSAAGVSSLLFANDKPSSNALLLSIKSDQAITYGIVKSIEDALNRLIQFQPYGKNFKVTFLNVSDYNRKEMADQYLKGAEYGAPTISAYCATIGVGQAEMDAMNFLEKDVLKLQERFVPLKGSAQLSASDTNDAGRPKLDETEIADQTESNQTRE